MKGVRKILEKTLEHDIRPKLKKDDSDPGKRFNGLLLLMLCSILKHNFKLSKLCWKEGEVTKRTLFSLVSLKHHIVIAFRLSIFHL